VKTKLLLLLFFIFSFAGAQGTWTSKASFGGIARSDAVGFSIGTKGYIGTGTNGASTYYKDFWEWDQATDVWTQKADFGGAARSDAVGFSIDTKGYIGTGGTAFVCFKDFWEWDQTTNIWTQRMDFQGDARIFAVGFSIGSKGYIGTGCNISSSNVTNYLNDFWEWDQTTNKWTQKAYFSGGPRDNAVGFSIGNKGYIGTGNDGYFSSYLNDFWEWDQAADNWTPKASFGGGARIAAVGFSIGCKGYIGTGISRLGFFKDFWEWDPGTNKWNQQADLISTSNNSAVGFSIGNSGYIGTGSSLNGQINDFSQWNATTVSKDYTICNGSSVIISASAGNSYSWNPSAGLNNVTISNPLANPTITTTYTVIVSNNSCADDQSTVTIVVNSLPNIIVSPPASSICSGNSILLNASGAASYVWSPSVALNDISSAAVIANPTIDITYTVTGTDNNLCTNQATVSLSIYSVPIITVSSDTIICSGSAAQLSAAGALTYNWSPETNPLTGAKVNVTPASTTIYTVTATDGNNCINKAFVKVAIDAQQESTIRESISKDSSVILNVPNIIGNKYVWTPSTTLSCGTCASPIASPSISTIYQLTQTDGIGCSFNSEVFITVVPLCKNIYIPNAFSPNGDGQNDVLYIYAYDGASCVDGNSYLFEVYDRWGNKVFRSRDIKEGWDGTYKGEKMDAAVFVYELIYSSEGRLYNLKGNISLIR